MSLASPGRKLTSLPTYLEELRELIGAALEDVWRGSTAPPRILEAMRYSVSGGGKRLRPCLTLAAAEAVGSRAGRPADGARRAALPNACAVELIHCYSLVHDDLPAMDDDTLRRGRPTVHVVFGEGVAILAGDGLLTEAFGVIASPGRLVPEADVRPGPAASLRAVRALAEAAGAAGMVGGQALDLASIATPEMNGTALEDIHARKTGALIRASAVLGGLAVEADDAMLEALDHFARELGLAFQIVDDLLDVEGSAAELGKTAGKDAAARKATYPALYGVDRSRRMAAECIGREKQHLASAGLSGHLSEIADWSLTRKR